MLRSRSNEYGNIVNSINTEPLKGFEPKLIQMLITVGRRSGCVFKVMRPKVRSDSDDHRKLVNSVTGELLNGF